MRSGNKARKSHQTWWNDLKPWVDQLYDDHRVYLDIRVRIFAEAHEMRPTVSIRAYRVLYGREEQTVAERTEVFHTEDQGHVEALVLRTASRFLLDLENEKDRAERQTALWQA